MLVRIPKFNLIKKNNWLLDNIYYFLFAIYCFSIPSFNERSPHYLVLYVFFAILVIAMIFSFFQKGNFIFDIKSLLFFALSLTSVVGTVIYSKQFGNMLSLFNMALSFFVFYIFYSNFDRKKALLSIALGFTAFLFYFYIVYLKEIITLSFISTRLGLYFGNQNLIASYFLYTIVLLLYFLLFEKIIFSSKIKNVLYYSVLLILLFLCLFAGITTGSRTFLIKTFVCFAVMFFIRFKNNIIILLVSTIVGFVILVLFFTIPSFGFLSSKIIDSVLVIFGIGNPSLDYSTYFRMTYMKMGFEIGLSNFLFGTGSFGFTTLAGVGTYSHSNFSEMLCNFGIIGFISYYSIFLIAIYYLFKLKNAHYPLLIALIAINILDGFSGVNYFQKSQTIILPVILAYSSFGVIRKKEIPYLIEVLI